MAGRRNTQRGQGFSLYGLQAEIAQVVDLLADALGRQGVNVNPDSLLMQIQSVVNTVGNGGLPAPVSDYGYMQASDEPVPYTVAGDLLAIAYEQFKGGDKRTSIKTLIAAMEYEDFGDITTGLLAMNAQSSEDDANKDTEVEDDEDLDDEDIDESDEDDDDDLSDDDIDSLLEDSDSTIEADDETKDNEEKDVTDEEEEDEKPTPEEVKPEPKEKPVEPKPKDAVAKKPMTEEVVASASQRAISNKLSMDGSKVGRSKAFEFISHTGNKKRVA